MHTCTCMHASCVRCLSCPLFVGGIPRMHNVCIVATTCLPACIPMGPPAGCPTMAALTPPPLQAAPPPQPWGRGGLERCLHLRGQRRHHGALRPLAPAPLFQAVRTLTLALSLRLFLKRCAHVHACTRVRAHILCANRWILLRGSPARGRAPGVGRALGGASACMHGGGWRHGLGVHAEGGGG